MSILAHKEFGVLRLTISRPEKRNAINARMFDMLTEAFSEAARDDAVRVVLVAGDDRLFSAGADLEEMQSTPEELERAMSAFFAELRGFPKPVVAQVAGPCVGEAFIMLLYCDLVYVSGEALFSLPAVALARTPRFGSAAIIEAAAGLPKAAEKLLLTEPISAEEAVSMRLVTAVIEPEHLEQVVAAKTARLAVLPPQAVQATKTLLTSARTRRLEADAESEEAVWRRQVNSDEAREALDAFLHGRKPVFRSAE